LQEIPKLPCSKKTLGASEPGIGSNRNLRGPAIRNPHPHCRLRPSRSRGRFRRARILKFVRAGNRFRDCAVLVRDLESYHKPLARVFRRYGIPFFLDRRESVTHHPLAELTRSALRTIAFDWQHNDWFAALKAGFCPVAETEIDRLENAALEFGWRGKKWREPLPDEFSERLRQKILPPFESFLRSSTGINSTDRRATGRRAARTLGTI
jgi:ATP-dependent helicase/DNAse subunit B